MCKAFFGCERIPAGKEGAAPVLAPDIETLDVIAMLMSNKKGRDVVCREPQFCHALQCLATRKAVVDHDEPLGAFDERAVAF